MGVAYFLLLSCLGFAITVQAQDCRQPVPGPNMSLRDQFINQESFSSGTTVFFSCNVGYQAAGGSLSITCTAGTWSTVRLKCERKSCGAVADVLHGQVDYIDGIEFGDKAVVTCYTGFTLVGKNELICEDQGWNTRPPVCEVVTCQTPDKVVDGTFSPFNEEYTYRDVVEYRCKDGYTIFGSKSRTCSEDGTFKPDAPTCTLIQCDEPFVANARWPSNPPYVPGSAVTIGCLDGYISKGGSSLTVTCDKTGNWSPGLPTCERITTTTTTTSTTSTTTKKKPIENDRDGEEESQPNSGLVIGVVVGVIFGTVALVATIFVCKKMKNKKTQGNRRTVAD
ncbi:complement receptor type 1-like isoform X3 [Betta splendens]|uniref:Complement receptor type 1-like isoform X3 n=1 Tax=Betta splendens TaxID=158456 RepID=A0A6P7N4H7_BETSP|nr:complement receptor type 1-like isoform X3 [Betta splendens]